MKDHYAVLQLDRRESPAGISARYRDMTNGALGRAAQGAVFKFEEIAEAYDVLSDTSRKRAYDKRLAQVDVEQPRPPTTIHQTSGIEVEPKSIFGDTHCVHPSLEALRERLLRNLTGFGIPKGERPECLAVEVILDPEQATWGGVVYIGMPVYRYCPICMGMSTESFMPCTHCDGRGVVEKVKAVPIAVPARIAPRATFEVSLDHLEISNLFLQAHILVSG